MVPPGRWPPCSGDGDCCVQHAPSGSARGASSGSDRVSRRRRGALRRGRAGRPRGLACPGSSPPCRGSRASRRTLCARNTRAPSHAETAVAASVPVSRSPTGRSSVSPTKSLLDSETSTGQPVATSSGSRRVTSRECQVFLPKSWPGSIRTEARSTPSPTARSAAADRRLDDVGHHVVVRHPVRPGPRGQPAGVRADEGRRRRPLPPRPAAGSVPPQASLSRSAPASQQTRPTSCRQVSTLITRSGCRARTSATKPTVRRISSAASTSAPGPAFTPPMSTMSAPSDDRAVDSRRARRRRRRSRPGRRTSRGCG